ncbi:cilia- and flagella-associated protein 52 [Agrilus planipennis]|uniref:Cilia- and flagella-associated protein 52 n=1 Tax=Agrilus planipennis TaxID=224129 RepID=A0A1W4XFJ7_AGRPL|nr:cilia- and flagella-associated protein 52 [Agrilus planipennis]
MSPPGEDVLEGGVESLEVVSIIGFDGSIVQGVKVHPDGKHIIYPVGNKVVIIDLDTKKQHSLSGHTNIISAINLSPSGKYIASGQINHIGFKAKIIIWDFAKREIKSSYELHKVRVEALAFSKGDHYLISIGGRDCGFVVVWDIAAGQPLCGTTATKGMQGEAYTVCTTNSRVPCFISGGDNNLTVWSIDREARSMSGVDVNMSKLKRQVLCIDIHERDEVCYCGTSTGDVLKIRLNFHHDVDILVPVKTPILKGCFTKIAKKTLPRGQVELYGQGVRSIILLLSGKLLIGAGDGSVDLVEEKQKDCKEKEVSVAFKLPSSPVLRILKSTNVNGTVTSLNFSRGMLLAGTAKSEIYIINMDSFEAELIFTCHTSVIYDICFPENFSDVFATASKDDVRVWSTSTFNELLRIEVANFSASAVVFSHDGKSIVTAWNDGVIRSFTPLTGKLIYAIMNSHNKGASALDITHSDKFLVSGGCEGQVRLWEVTPYRQKLVCVLKEHKAPISAIHINSNDDEAASASTDGSCIIWDLIRKCRKQILFSNTLFMCVRFYPTDVQLLTGGSDRKVAYWEVYDGNLIREVEGSASGSVNTLDISEDGNLFVTGANDQIVKLWKYQEGITTHIGVGHAAVVTAIRFSPDTKLIVSGSGAGSIFVWKNPFYVEKKEEETKKAEAVEEEKHKSDEKVADHQEDIKDIESVRSAESAASCKCKCATQPCLNISDLVQDENCD